LFLNPRDIMSSVQQMAEPDNSVGREKLFSGE